MDGVGIGDEVVIEAVAEAEAETGAGTELGLGVEIEDETEVGLGVDIEDDNEVVSDAGVGVGVEPKELHNCSSSDLDTQYKLEMRMDSLGCLRQAAPDACFE